MIMKIIVSLLRLFFFFEVPYKDLLNKLKRGKKKKKPSWLDCSIWEVIVC